MIARAIVAYDLPRATIDLCFDFVNLSAAIYGEFDQNLAFVFIDEGKTLHHDVRFGHINHGHGESYVAINVPIELFIRLSTLYRAWQNLIGG